MPQKEHLAFESTTPAFLRRLRGELPSGPSGSSTDPDRHATPQIRARRPRDVADQDDEPVYVDAGTGQTLSTGEIDEMKQSEVKSDSPVGETKAGVDDIQNANPGEKATVKAVMHVGHSKKKREAPVVVSENGKGGAEEDKRNDEGPNKQSSSKDSQEKAPKLKRKAKKIKLSFDDDQ